MRAIWHLPDGRIVTADVKADQSPMEAAVALNLPHVTGDCGGNMACDTCHVSVDVAWFGMTGGPDGFEGSTWPRPNAPRHRGCLVRSA